MIRIEWFCKRCGSHMRTEEYNFQPGYEELRGANITEDICENCLCEYEALKCRQGEERRLFWEGAVDG